MAALGASLREIGAFLWSEAALVLAAALLLAAGLGWLLAVMLVAMLQHVFDPPPDQLAVPWPFLGGLAGAAVIGAAVAVALARAQDFGVCRSAPYSARNDRRDILDRSRTTRRCGVLVAACAKRGSARRASRTGRSCWSGSAPRPDALVVDIGLPDADGRDVCPGASRRGHRGARSSSSRRATPSSTASPASSAGGDDYLTKPFAFAELVARLQALLRRAGPTRRSRSAASGSTPSRTRSPAARRHGRSRPPSSGSSPPRGRAGRGRAAARAGAGRPGRTAPSSTTTRSTPTSRGLRRKLARSARRARDRDRARRGVRFA